MWPEPQGRCSSPSTVISGRAPNLMVWLASLRCSQPTISLRQCIHRALRTKQKAALTASSVSNVRQSKFGLPSRSCICVFESAVIPAPEDVFLFNVRAGGDEERCGWRRVKWPMPKEAYLKSDRQFSTRVMGAAFSGMAVFPMKCWPSGDTS